MIDGSSAVGRGDNSTFVALEDRLVCFENNWNGSIVQSSSDLIGIIRREANIVYSSNYTSTSVVSASLTGGNIRIGILSLEGVCSRVSEGWVHPATIAATVFQVAINELLLREGIELSSFDSVVSF
jgi:hypothetical protein